MPQGAIRHFGVLIPSTNTTAEIEYSRLLPPEWQAHYARMATSSINKTPFSPPRDEDVDYQAKMLGTARVEIVFLLQTSASLFAEGYCADVSRRISAAAGVPALHLGHGDRRGDGRARREAHRAGVALFAGGESPAPSAITRAATGCRSWRSRALPRPIRT